jgi:hypothetical protein
MAFFPCPDCGTKLPYASKEHPCRGSKNTPEASGTARKAPSGSVLAESSRNLVRASTHPVAKATKGKAGTAEVKGLVRRSTAGTGLRVGEAVAVQPATSEFMDVTGRRDVHQIKRGRGRPKVTGPRPWETAGVSKTTYYRERRRAEQKETK